MSINQSYYSVNNFYANNNRLAFKSGDSSRLPVLKKPIDKIEKIGNSVDEFVTKTDDEETKKSHKKAIRVGSIVLVLSTIGLMLNPKFSSSLINKLKTKSTTAANKAKVDNTITGKWNKFKEKFLTGLTNFIQILNNLNSAKDEAFQKLCNKTKITKKIHQSITKGFDKISKHTVFSKYDKVKKKMDLLDEIMKTYGSRLSASDRKILEEKMRQIDNLQEYFTKSQTSARLNNQEKLMGNLEDMVWAKIKAYKNGFFEKGTEKGKHAKEAYKFWAEEALMPERNRLEEEGANVVNSLVGDGKTQKGAYREVIDLLSSKLSAEEKRSFEETVKKTDKLLRSANKSECIEYFDKKRDLILGSAPTDVLTAVLSLLASGVAIGVADSKEDRISRTITGVLPVIAGLGTSTALTALLFSGGKSLAIGTGSSVVFSGIGSAVNRAVFHKDKIADTKKEEPPVQEGIA